MKKVEGSGREAGAVNVVTREVKAIIELAFEGAGGLKAFTAWAKKKPDLFYVHVFTKLIPKDFRISADASVASMILAAGQLMAGLPVPVVDVPFAVKGDPGTPPVPREEGGRLVEGEGPHQDKT